MGIQGLLPLLKSIHANTHISEFSGQTLAVDGYVWLHRGAFSCAPQVVRGEKTTKYVEYFLHRVRMLRHNGVEPFCVFDGGPLPAKLKTESDRAKKREENLEKANKLAALGRHAEARDYYTKCVDVTPEMAFQVIKGLQAEGVRFVVAPYEADAQLAYLEREGIVNGIITEDSDLLVFGCKNVIFKLDSDGNCVNIKRENFGSVKDTPLTGWSDQEFRQMAMLSGCDYLSSIVGLGLKTAHRLLRKYKTVEKVLQFIRLESSMKIPNGYLAAFRIAELAFLYQRVYDPRSKSLVHLTPIPNPDEWTTEMESYVGSEMDQDFAQGIAEGTVDPTTLLPMADINPGYAPKDKKSTRPPLRERNRTVAPTGPTIDHFFTVIPKSKALTSTTCSVAAPLPTTGNGMKTLSEQMEAEREMKQTKIASLNQPKSTSTSKFFTAAHAPSKPSSPKKRKRAPEDDIISTPRNPQRSRSTSAEKENVKPLVHDPVTQEEGYQSPCGESVIADVSSPIERLSIADGDDCARDDDEVSSPAVGPTSQRRQKPPRSSIVTLCAQTPELSPTKAKLNQQPKILVVKSPSPAQSIPVNDTLGVDLRSIFRDDNNGKPVDAGIDDEADGDRTLVNDEDQLTPASGMLFDKLNAKHEAPWEDDLFEDDIEEDLVAMEAQKTVQRMMAGWRSQWSRDVSSSSLSSSGPSQETPLVALSQVTLPGKPTKPLNVKTADKASQVKPGSQKRISSSFKRRRPLEFSQNISKKQPFIPISTFGIASSSKSAVGGVRPLSRGSKSSPILIDDAGDGLDDGPSLAFAHKLQSFRYA